MPLDRSNLPLTLAAILLFMVVDEWLLVVPREIAPTRYVATARRLIGCWAALQCGQ